MSDNPKIPPEDSALFRQAVGPVKPLKHNQTVPAKSRPLPVPAKTQADEEQVLQDMLSDDYDPCDIETGEELLFSRTGIQHTVLRKLRRGQYALEAELDLHGLTVPEARAALAQFLARCRHTGMRCVRIVHGKGHGSHQKRPVLKGKVNKWLQQRDEVLAFCSARPADGGTGAVYVLLKRG